MDISTGDQSQSIEVHTDLLANCEGQDPPEFGNDLAADFEVGQSLELDRPDSLDLTSTKAPESQDAFEAKLTEEDNSTDDETSLTYCGGTYTKTGDMIEFVADNISEKIKTSSNTGSRTSSFNSVSSSPTTSLATSPALSQSSSSILQHSPDDVPPIDPLAVIDLERQAKVVADRLDLMMGNLKNNLHKMLAITAESVETYRKSVDNTCDSVDATIKSMYTLMARCEEMSKSFEPVYQLSNEIKEVRRLLDTFELTMDRRI